MKFLSQKWILTISEVILLLTSGYFVVFKKALDISLTESLGEKLNLNEKGLKFIVFFLCGVIFLSILIKTISIICERFNIVERKIISPEGITEACKNLNKEIEDHLSLLKNGDKKQFIRELKRYHHYEPNVRLITIILADHLKESLKIQKIKKDIYISIYQVPNFENGASLCNYDQKNKQFEPQSNIKVNQLQYLAHWNPASSHTYSEIITIDADNFSEYECIKAYKNGTYLHTKANLKKYHLAGNPNRTKSVKQFLCFFIKINTEVVGLVNIEFHNRAIFDSDEDMRNYVHSDLMSYKFLIEYEFLKKRFTQAISN